MRTSVRWINDYLEPKADEHEIADGLTRAGFPLDGRFEEGGEVSLEIETTSNRGDCLCHVGLARELAAITSRSLKSPAGQPKFSSPAASSLASVENLAPEECPLYTGRIIRGIKVGPSPDWLAQRLRAIGQIPRNNVVDATNFVLFELGQPTHVFDLAKLRGSKIIVRKAHAGEPFLPIGEGAAEVKLTSDDLVIADGERAVAIAGVKGGALTAVSNSTTDVLLEAATFDAVAVRQASRRHRISSDSSYRFERGVHPAQVNAAADRLAALILEVAGGTLCEGVLSAGKALPTAGEVKFRPQRCRDIIGMPISDDMMIDCLGRLGFAPKRSGSEIACTVPAHRLDIEREIDLIEEVARMHGLDGLPISETIPVRVNPIQPRIAGRRAMKDLLVGLGFVETITHSLVGESAAAAFVPAGGTALRLADERASAEPVLRPSLIPSLLRVRRHNQDNNVTDLRLFEVASTFHKAASTHAEHEMVGLLMDNAPGDLGTRPLRGTIDRLVLALGGASVNVEVKPDAEAPAWLSPGARVSVGGVVVGWMGMVSGAIQKSFGLDVALLGAELNVQELLKRYPPEPQAHALPEFPAIERDLSIVVVEDVAWAAVADAVNTLKLEHLEAVEFVTTYRGKQVGAGRKSVTLRLRFRSHDRTLRHDEVDAQMTRTIETLKQEFQAEVRS